MMTDQSREVLFDQLQDVVNRFNTYCGETPQQETQPTTAILDKGDVMGLFPSTPSLGVYEQLREQFMDKAAVIGPRHRA